jgi:hypothetical protein
VSLNIPEGVTVEGMGTGTVLHVDFVDGAGGQNLVVWGRLRDVRMVTESPGFSGSTLVYSYGSVEGVETAGLGFMALPGGRVSNCDIKCIAEAGTTGFSEEGGLVIGCQVLVTGGGE